MPLQSLSGGSPQTDGGALRSLGTIWNVDFTIFRRGKYCLNLVLKNLFFFNFKLANKTSNKCSFFYINY